MDEKKEKPASKDVSEPTLTLTQVNELVAKAVADAMVKKVHQHTPVEELSGRSRENGTLIVETISDGKGHVEYRYNDGTVRRDYK